MRSYPIHEPGFVGEAATLFDTDPFLILSVMKVESGFDPAATSPVGAIGLMQVMPDTADWIVNHVRPEGLECMSEGWTESELYDPRKNILVGSWYLSYLQQRFGDVGVALAAYNGGQGRVSAWLEAKQVRAGDRFSVDDIPLAETRSFVRRVLAVREWYDRLYRGRLIF
jgi:soluble lytic murein transglycosylase